VDKIEETKKPMCIWNKWIRKPQKKANFYRRQTENIPLLFKTNS